MVDLAHEGNASCLLSHLNNSYQLDRRRKADHRCECRICDSVEQHKVCQPVTYCTRANKRQHNVATFADAARAKREPDIDMRHDKAPCRRNILNAQPALGGIDPEPLGRHRRTREISSNDPTQHANRLIDIIEQQIAADLAHRLGRRQQSKPIAGDVRFLPDPKVEIVHEGIERRKIAYLLLQGRERRLRQHSFKRWSRGWLRDHHGLHSPA